MKAGDNVGPYELVSPLGAGGGLTPPLVKSNIVK